MSITGQGGVLVAPPSCMPAKYGLLSVVDLEERTDAHWQTGVETELETCEGVYAVTPCPGTPIGSKPTGGGTVTPAYGDPFTLVGAYDCAVGGRIPAQAWEHAQLRLERGEGRGLETAFWTGVDVVGNVIPQSLGQNADVVDITPVPGTAVSITDGLAQLESYMGEQTLCSPIIHATRGVATYFADRNLVREDGSGGNSVLRAVGTGTRIAVGGGYGITGPEGNTPAAGKGWIFATGGIKLLRGAVFFTPEVGAQSAAINRDTNDITVYAERPYSFLLDCAQAAILVNLQSCC